MQMQSGRSIKYSPLRDVEPAEGASPKPTGGGPWKRLYWVKVILVVGVLLTIVNLFNYRFDMKLERLSFLRSNYSSSPQLHQPAISSRYVTSTQNQSKSIPISTPLKFIIRSRTHHKHMPFIFVLFQCVTEQQFWTKTTTIQCGA